MFFIATGPAWGVLSAKLPDWYDSTLPVFVSDAKYDRASGVILLTDQITGALYGYGVDTPISPIQNSAAGFIAGRDEVLQLVLDPAFPEWLEGNVDIGGNLERAVLRDGRASYGTDMWITVIRGDTMEVRHEPTKLDRLALLPGADQSDNRLAAQAIIYLAEKGERIRPLKFKADAENFQLIDDLGRLFLFDVESGFFGQKQLNLRFRVDSLYARIRQFSLARGARDDTGTLYFRMDTTVYEVIEGSDEFTGEPIFTVEMDTDAQEFPDQGKRGRRKFPAGRRRTPPNRATGHALPEKLLNGFYRVDAILSQGPAGTLVKGRVNLSRSGESVWLALIIDGTPARLIPWNGHLNENPEHVTATDNGFFVGVSSGYRFIGISEAEDFRLSGAHPQAASIIDATAGGLYILDAVDHELRFIENPQTGSIRGIQPVSLPLEQLDVGVNAQGNVYLLAQDRNENGYRLFRLDSGKRTPVQELSAGFFPRLFSNHTLTLLSGARGKAPSWVWTFSDETQTLIREFSIPAPPEQIHQGGYWIGTPGAVRLTLLRADGTTAGSLNQTQIPKSMIAVPDRRNRWWVEQDDGIYEIHLSEDTHSIERRWPNAYGLRAVTDRVAMFAMPAAGGYELAVMEYPDDADFPYTVNRFTFANKIDPLTVTQDGVYYFEQSAGKRRLMQARLRPQTRSSLLSGNINFKLDTPQPVMVCAIGQSAYCAAADTQSAQWSIGSIPRGVYDIDVSEGLFDVDGPAQIQTGSSHQQAPDITLAPTLDFIFSRAAAQQRAGDIDMAKYNLDLYLKLYPQGVRAWAARNMKLDMLLHEEDFTAAVEFYKTHSAHTLWSAENLRLLFDHIPSLADRMSLANKLLERAGESETAKYLFFLYKYSLDPAFRRAAQERLHRPVLRRFFDAFDRVRLEMKIDISE